MAGKTAVFFLTVTNIFNSNTLFNAQNEKNEIFMCDAFTMTLHHIKKVKNNQFLNIKIQFYRAFILFFHHFKCQSPFIISPTSDINIIFMFISYQNKGTLNITAEYEKTVFSIDSKPFDTITII